MNWHRGIMVAFDVESTSPHPTEARIVTARIVQVEVVGASDRDTASTILHKANAHRTGRTSLDFDPATGEIRE